MKKKQLRFRVNPESGASVGDIEVAIQEAWVESRITGSIAHANAVAHGIDPASLPEDPAAHLKVERDAGIATVEAATIVFLSKVAWDVWSHVAMPHIRRLWGDRAIAAAEKKKRAVAQKEKQASSTGQRAAAKKAPRKKGQRVRRGK